MSAAGEPATGPPTGSLTGSARELTAAAWRSASVLLVAYLVSMVARAMTPIAAAWLTKLVVDRLVDLLAGAGGAGGLVGLALGLAGVGAAAVVLPQVGGYLSNEIGRRFTVDTTERLFAAATGLPGLRPFENPRFLDRLRMAQDGISMGG